MTLVITSQMHSVQHAERSLLFEHVIRLLDKFIDFEFTSCILSLRRDRSFLCLQSHVPFAHNGVAYKRHALLLSSLSLVVSESAFRAVESPMSFINLSQNISPYAVAQGESVGQPF